jgi:hypothetical protein
VDELLVDWKSRRTDQRKSMGNLRQRRQLHYQPNHHLINRLSISRLARSDEQKYNEQNVRLMIMLFESNSEAISQLVSGKFADGVPQLSVLTVSLGFETSDGTAPFVLDQNHTLIKESVRSMAYHPPPWALKGGP